MVGGRKTGGLSCRYLRGQVPFRVAEEFELDDQEYDHALDRGLSVSGEDREYFARGRAAYLKRLLRGMGEQPRSLLDFGCGSGVSSLILRETLGAEELVGVDVSERLLESARRLYFSSGLRFLSAREWEPDGSIDLAFCNGVFHHIPTAERQAVLRHVCTALRPGGLFALWENNPWSPAARYVMSRIPFDRHAAMVWPDAIAKLLGYAGFAVLRTDYCFIFPRSLRKLRFLEPALARLPVGAQYQVLARRPLEVARPSLV